MRPISEFREALESSVDAGEWQFRVISGALVELEATRVMLQRIAEQPDVAASFHAPFEENVADGVEGALESAQDELASARERIAALEGQVGVLREALRRLGRHGDRCNSRVDQNECPHDPYDGVCGCESVYGPCDCGLAAALASTTPTTEGPKETP